MDVAKGRRNETGGNYKRLIVLVGILLCIIISFVALYPALRNYYLAYRVNEQLLQELAAVEERNDEIRAQIDYLNTPEGIADRARERFGWVPVGEEAVNITGLDVLDSTTVLPASIAVGSVAAPNNEWTDFLDAFFAIEEEEAPEQIPDPFINESQ